MPMEKSMPMGLEECYSMLEYWFFRIYLNLLLFINKLICFYI